MINLILLRVAGAARPDIFICFGALQEGFSMIAGYNVAPLRLCHYLLSSECPPCLHMCVVVFTLASVFSIVVKLALSMTPPTIGAQEERRVHIHEEPCARWSNIPNAPLFLCLGKL